MAEENQNTATEANTETNKEQKENVQTSERKNENEQERSARPVRNSRPQNRGRGNKPFYAKKVCRFCTKQINEKDIDYKNIDLLRRYVMPSGKIVPRRINGNCAKHQRRISEEIKKARILAFLPFMDR